MAENDPAGKPAADPGNGPTGQSDPAAQVKDPEGLLAKNKELLGELKKAQKELSEFRSAQDKANDAKLKEEGKLKELVDAKEKQLADKTAKARRAELKAAARKYELVDDDYIDILAKQVEFNENDEPQNLDDVFKALREAKPYLFKQADPAPAPGTANKGGTPWKPGGKALSMSEINAMSPDELLKNSHEILKQGFAGQIK